VQAISQNCKMKIASAPRHFTGYFKRGGGFERGEEGSVQAEPQVSAIGSRKKSDYNFLGKGELK